MLVVASLWHAHRRDHDYIRQLRWCCSILHLLHLVLHVHRQQTSDEPPTPASLRHDYVLPSVQQI